MTVPRHCQKTKKWVVAQILEIRTPSQKQFGSITTNKASGGHGIPVELFQILKDDAVKVLHSICQQIWKTQQWPQDWKRAAFIPISKKSNAKESSNHCTIVFISHANKRMVKSFKQYVNQELLDVQADLEKQKNQRSNC